MPAAIPIAAAVAAAAVPAIAGGAGVGKNKARATTFDKTTAYDPARTNYGGSAAAAEQWANTYGSEGWQAQSRTGPEVAYGAQGLDQYNRLGLASRNSQKMMANQMMGRALGLTPSIAQMQADRQMQQATAAQASAAASARGPGGLALAQQNAANNTATMQSAISNQAQINAAQERMAAEQAAFGAYSGMRDTDMAAAGQAQQRAQFDAGLQMQQRALNDQYTQNLYGLSHNIRTNQLQAGLGEQGIMAGSLQGAQNLNMGANQNNANLGVQWTKAAMGGIEGAAQMYQQGGGKAGSDDRMKQGMSYVSDDRAKLAKAWEEGRAAGLIAASPQAEMPADFVAPSGPSPLPPPRSPLPPGVRERTPGERRTIAYDFAPARRDRPTDKAGSIGGSYAPHAPVARQPTSFERGVTLAPEQIESARLSPADEALVARMRATGAGLLPASVFEDSGAVVSDERSKMSMRDGNDATAQFARGLAPITYEYKPGMGDGPGPRTGVRAQAMLEEPLTAPAVERGNDGLLAINVPRGMSTALAGVGHNAQEIAKIKAALETMRKRAA